MTMLRWFFAIILFAFGINEIGEAFRGDGILPFIAALILFFGAYLLTFAQLARALPASRPPLPEDMTASGHKLDQADSGRNQASGMTSSSSIDDLALVLRESEGAYKREASLTPLGRMSIDQQGKTQSLEAAMFAYLGDMHVRFVFDSPQTMRVLGSEEFKQLKLSPDQAVSIALRNIRRVYGAPKVHPHQNGLFQLLCKLPDLNSAYMLDLDFWRSMLEQHPSGIVAQVPERGILRFCAFDNRAGVQLLRQFAYFHYAEAGHLRISSALYLFNDDGWSVFQAPYRPQPELAARYLALLDPSATIAGGLSYRQALAQSRLDYSLDSLKRLDLLLDKIRAAHIKDRTTYLSSPANRNFLMLLGYYCGTVCAQHIGASTEWPMTDSFSDMLQSADSLAPCLPCIFSDGPREGQTLFPLQCVEARLFDGDTQESCYGMANGLQLEEPVTAKTRSVDGELTQPGKVKLVESDLFKIKLPSDWLPFTDKAAVLAFQAPGGTKKIRLYLFKRDPSKAETTSDVAAKFKQQERMSLQQIDGCKFQIVDQNYVESAGIGTFSLDAYELDRGTRLLYRILIGSDWIVRFSLHDFACPDYPLAKATFAPIMASLELNDAAHRELPHPA